MGLFSEMSMSISKMCLLFPSVGGRDLDRLVRGDLPVEDRHRPPHPEHSSRLAQHILGAVEDLPERPRHVVRVDPGPVVRDGDPVCPRLGGLATWSSATILT